MRCAICRNSGSAALREVFLASLAARKAVSAVWKLPSLVWKSLRALVSGVRSAATSPKVAKFAFSTEMKLYQSQGQSLQLPPSLRFPPLREGNRVGRVGSVPPACRGNLKEGVSISLVFVNCVPAIGIRRRWIGVKSTERRGNAPARGAWGGYRTRWGTARRALRLISRVGVRGINTRCRSGTTPAASPLRLLCRPS